MYDSTTSIVIGALQLGDGGVGCISLRGFRTAKGMLTDIEVVFSKIHILAIRNIHVKFGIQVLNFVDPSYSYL